TISRAQLVKPFPQMTGLSQGSSPLGRVRTNGVELTFQRRWAKGFTLYSTYTGTKGRIADYFQNQFDDVPAFRESNNSRPHRVTSTGTYQLPFGRRRPFFRSGALSKALGGLQIAGTIEYQKGPLLDWGRIFYYGDLANIKSDVPTLAQWFDTAGTPCGVAAGPNTGFQRCANQGPDTYDARSF